LAKQTPAPDTVLIYESGTLGAKPTVLPLSIGDGELSETADAVVSIPEMFAYWLQGGRIELGFLGAAQIDKYANINSTVIGGTYRKPKVRLPGSGGAQEIAGNCGEVLITLRHNKRAFVEKLDFMTSGGHFEGGESRAKLKLPGQGPTAVITDLGILTPDPVTKELTLTSVHPDVTVEQVVAETGWPLKISGQVGTTEPPTEHELAVLRDLNERTARAHAGQQ
jgi:glutaconate CoA-transferase subunit B